MLQRIPPERYKHACLRSLEDYNIVAEIVSHKPSFPRNDGPTMLGDKVIKEGHQGYHPDDCRLGISRGSFELNIKGMDNLKKLKEMINFAIEEFDDGCDSQGQQQKNQTE